MGKHWDRLFESHSGHACIHFSSQFVLSRVARGLATERYPVQGVISNVYKADSETRRPWTAMVCGAIQAATTTGKKSRNNIIKLLLFGESRISRNPPGNVSRLSRCRWPFPDKTCHLHAISLIWQLLGPEKFLLLLLKIKYSVVHRWNLHWAKYFKVSQKIQNKCHRKFGTKFTYSFKSILTKIFKMVYPNKQTHSSYPCTEPQSCFI
jgi:hypothetical protein